MTANMTNKQLVEYHSSLNTNAKEFVPSKEQVCPVLPLKYLNSNFTNSEGKTVCFGGVKYFDIKCTDTSFIQWLFNSDSVSSVQRLYDGTLIRVFFENGEVCIATNKCKDASKASWENVGSFKDIFEETAKTSGLNYPSLSQTATHYFVLQHTLNRIVTPVTENKLVYLGSYNNESSEKYFEQLGEWTGLVVNDSLDTDLEQIILDCWNSSWDFPGYMIRTTNGKNIRIEAKNYTAVKDLKGNMVSRGKNWRIVENVDPASYRLIQIIKNKQCDEFLIYFPEYSIKLEQVWNDLQKLSQDIFQEYRNLRVLKTITECSPKYKTFITRAHSRYHQTHHPILVQDIWEMIMICPMDTLMKAIEYKDITVME
jgi:hypothetical protein